MRDTMRILALMTAGCASSATPCMPLDGPHVMRFEALSGDCDAPPPLALDYRHELAHVRTDGRTLTCLARHAVTLESP